MILAATDGFAEGSEETVTDPRLPLLHAVDRPDLRARLDAALGSPLSLVRAPACAGKSVLLAQWAGSRPDLAFAWFDLTDADRDTAGFAQRLVTGLASVAPDLAGRLPIVRSSDDRLGTAFLEELATGIVGAQRVVLIFDDVDHLSGSPLLDDLWQLVDLLPPNAHVVFSSRADLHLGWSRQRLENRLVEIRQRDLALDDATTARVLASLTGRAIDRETASTVCARTEGWVAGVHLMALALRFVDDRGSAQGESGDDAALIRDYFDEEVVAALEPDLGAALARLSVLDEMNAALAEVVTGIAPGAGPSLLTTLERESLFLVPVVGRVGWYRLHRLFREALRFRLRAEAPAAEEDALATAGEWFLAAGETDSAIEYLMRARRWERAVELILRTGHEVYEESTTARIAQWLSLVPMEFVRGRTDVGLLRAMTDGMSGRASLWLDALRRVAADPTATVGQRQIALAYLSAGVQFHPHPQAFLDIAHRARDLLDRYPDEQPPSLLGLTSRSLLVAVSDVSRARALLHLGRLSQAREVLIDLFASDALVYLPYRVHALGTLAVVEALSGRLRQAKEHADEALGFVEAAGLWEHPASADTHLARVLIAVNRGEAERSLPSLEHAMVTAGANNRTQLLWLVHMAQRRIEPQRRTDYPAMGSPPPVVRDALTAIAMRLARTRGVARMPAPAPEWSATAVEEIAAHIVARHPARAGERLESLARGVRVTPLGAVEVDLLRAWIQHRLGADRRARDHLESALARAAGECLVDPFLRIGGALLPLLADTPTGRAEFGRHIAHRLACAATPTRVEPPTDALTPRELELIAYLPSRYSIAGIAERCFVSTNTVKTHLGHIYRKLGVASRDEAIARAIELGLIHERSEGLPSVTLGFLLGDEMGSGDPRVGPEQYSL